MDGARCWGVRRGLKLLATGDCEVPDPLVEAWAGEPGDSSDGVAVVELAGTGLAVAQVPLCGCGTRGKHLHPATGLLPRSTLCPGEADMNIRSAQKRAWQNKIVKGFNTSDVPLEFCLLQGEIAEAFDAWRTGREDLGEELADVAIYLLSLAEMTGVDLQDEIEAKMAKTRHASTVPCRMAHSRRATAPPTSLRRPRPSASPAPPRPATRCPCRTASPAPARAQTVAPRSVPDHLKFCTERTVVLLAGRCVPRVPPIPPDPHLVRLFV